MDVMDGWAFCFRIQHTPTIRLESMLRVRVEASKPPQTFNLRPTAIHARLLLLPFLDPGSRSQARLSRMTFWG